MLQKLREKTTGWVAGIIVGILIIPFAFLGINDYFSSRVETWVAKVGKREITQQQFRDRLEQERARMRQQQGAAFDPRTLEDPLIKRQLLDTMIDEELVLSAAEDDGVVATDEAVRNEIARIPAFQVEGKFNQDQYRIALTSQGMSPNGFDALVRRDLLLRAVPLRVESTALVDGSEVDAFLQLNEQVRDLKLLDVIPPANDTAPTDDELHTWYQAHQNEFLSEEKVSIEFVELNSADFSTDTQVDEATLRTRYDEAKARFVDPERRLASHILLAMPKDADDAKVAEVKAKADALVTKARAPGADFAALARESTEDIGSKAAGGDLGWLENGATFAEFDTALYALAPGAISDPVRGESGFHIIWLRDVKPGNTKTFEQVHDQLAAEALESERERHFSDVSGQLMDAVYRDPSSLASAATELGLKVGTAGPMTHAGGEGVAANPAVIRAAFSEALAQGAASDPIELEPGHIVVIRVTEREAAQPRPLADVRADVDGAVRLERAATAGEVKAKELLARAQKGESLEQLAADAGGTVSTVNQVARRASSPDRVVVEEAFKLARPDGDKLSVGMAALGGGRFALVQVLAVTDGDPEKLPKDQREAVRGQYASARGRDEVRAFVKALRAQYPVQVAEQRL
jgi:peptidyl-prolyl cis-trans isomerase D